MDDLCPKCRHAVPTPTAGESRLRCGNCGHRWTPDIGPPTTPQAVPAPPPQATLTPGPSEGWAIASLICGLIFFVPFLTQILALLFGIVAFRRTNRDRPTARVMAGTGMGCAVIAAILWIWAGVFYMQLTRPTPVAVATTGPAAPVAWGYAGASPYSHLPAGRVSETQLKAKEILRGLVMYRQDFRRWPKTIDDLIPTYLSRDQLRMDRAFDQFGRKLESDQPEQPLFKYVPPPPDTFDSDNKRILVYSIRLVLDDEGREMKAPKRWGIWTNNVIELLEERVIAETLGIAVENLTVEP